jgi:hypothetical protein
VRFSETPRCHTQLTLTTPMQMIIQSISSNSRGKMLSPIIHDLSRDPETKNGLNVNSFQQSAITSFNGYQYCTFYRTQSHERTVRHVVLGRRDVYNGNGWEFLEFEDYEQTTDDGHNTVSMGICRGDGTIHLSFDHHTDDLKYRVSQKYVASDPRKFKWGASLFSPILNKLGNSQNSTSLPVLQLVTYPRFVNVGDGLLFEYRHGK